MCVLSFAYFPARSLILRHSIGADQTTSWPVPASFYALVWPVPRMAAASVPSPRVLNATFGIVPFLFSECCSKGYMRDGLIVVRWRCIAVMTRMISMKEAHQVTFRRVSLHENSLKDGKDNRTLPIEKNYLLQKTCSDKKERKGGIQYPRHSTHTKACINKPFVEIYMNLVLLSSLKTHQYTVYKYPTQTVSLHCIHHWLISNKTKTESSLAQNSPPSNS